MRRSRRTSRPAAAAIRGTAITAAIVALATVGTGAAVAGAVSCGQTITADTTLNGDLLDCPGDGLVIGADDVTLDLNRHTIYGDATPGVNGADGGIRLAGHHGVTIQNGTVQEFVTGVLLDSATGNRLRHLSVSNNAPGRGIDLENHSDDNLIEHDTAADNARAGIGMVSSDHNVVRDNITRDNATGIVGHTAGHNRIERNVLTGNGLGLGEGSNDNIVTGNTESGDPETGLGLGGDRNVVTDNRVSHNPGGITFNGDGNTIAANSFSDNGVAIAVEGGSANLVAGNSVDRTSDSEGIRVNAYPPDTAPAVGTVIRANLVRNAHSDGIAVATDLGAPGPVTDTRLEANVVIGSGHDGINVASASTTLTRNLALRNGNLGIEAVPGVTDGDGNHAFANGNPIQCLNVAC